MAVCQVRGFRRPRVSAKQIISHASNRRMPEAVRPTLALKLAEQCLRRHDVDGAREALRCLPNTSPHKLALFEYCGLRDRAEIAFFAFARAVVDWRARHRPLLPPLLAVSLDDLELALLDHEARFMDALRTLPSFLLNLPKDAQLKYHAFNDAFDAWHAAC